MSLYWFWCFVLIYKSICTQIFANKDLRVTDYTFFSSVLLWCSSLFPYSDRRKKNIVWIKKIHIHTHTYVKICIIFINKKTINYVNYIIYNLFCNMLYRHDNLFSYLQISCILSYCRFCNIRIIIEYYTQINNIRFKTTLK